MLLLGSRVPRSGGLPDRPRLVYSFGAHKHFLTQAALLRGLVGRPYRPASSRLSILSRMRADCASSPNIPIRMLVCVRFAPVASIEIFTLVSSACSAYTIASAPS